MTSPSKLVRILVALVAVLSTASAGEFFNVNLSVNHLLLLLAFDAHPQIAQAATILSGHRERLYGGSPSAVRGAAFEGYTSSGVAHQTLPDTTTITTTSIDNNNDNNNATSIYNDDDLDSANLTSITTSAAFRRRLSRKSGDSATTGAALPKRVRRNANEYKFQRPPRRELQFGGPAAPSNPGAGTTGTTDAGDPPAGPSLPSTDGMPSIPSLPGTSSTTANTPKLPFNASVIFSLWPDQGSFAGGTYLTIKGAGFNRAGMPGTTTVTIGGEPCIQTQGIVLDSTDSGYVCWTPPRPDRYSTNSLLYPEDTAYNQVSSQTLDVVVTLTDLQSGLSVSTKSNGGFTYKREVTPIITFASLSGYPGSIVKIAAKNIPDTFENASIFWIRTGGTPGGFGTGGFVCTVDKRMQVSGAPVLCNLGVGNSTSEAGRYELFFEPRDNVPDPDHIKGKGYGQPVFLASATQNVADVQPEPGMSRPKVTFASAGRGLTIRPIITGASFYRLGSGGGQTITIWGLGFSLTQANNEVFLGHENTPCVVTESSLDHITCIAGASSGTSPAAKFSPYDFSGSSNSLKYHEFEPSGLYAGGAGLVSRQYVGQFDYSIRENSAWYGDMAADFGLQTPTFMELNADSAMGRSFYPPNGDAGFQNTGRYYEDLSGFFVPPVSGHYTFYLRGVPLALLFFGNDKEKADTALADIPSTMWGGCNSAFGQKGEKWGLPLDGDNWSRNRDYEFNVFWADDTSTRWSDDHKDRWGFTCRASKRYLEKGQPKRFRFAHSNGNNGGWGEVAVRIHLDGGKNKEATEMFSSPAQLQSRSMFSHYMITVAGKQGPKGKCSLEDGWWSASCYFAISLTLDANRTVTTGPLRTGSPWNLVWQALRDALEKNGIPVQQMTVFTEDHFGSKFFPLDAPGNTVNVAEARRDESGASMTYVYSIYLWGPDFKNLMGSGINVVTAGCCVDTYSYICPIGWYFSGDYGVDAVCYQCPNGMTTDAEGAQDASSCFTPCSTTAITNATNTTVSINTTNTTNCRFVNSTNTTSSSGLRRLFQQRELQENDDDRPVLSPVKTEVTVPWNLIEDPDITPSHVDTLVEGGGDPFFWPIPADFFQVAIPLPGIQVRSNGLLASCDHILPPDDAVDMVPPYNQPNGNYPKPLLFQNTPELLRGCSIIYDASLTPTVTSITASAAPLANGTVLTIIGTKFIRMTANVTDPNVVNLLGSSGAALAAKVSYPCKLTAATTTQLKCTVPSLTEGTYTVEVIVGNGGGRAQGVNTVGSSNRRALANASPGLSVSGISPSAGSRGGGTNIVISGLGFTPGIVPNCGSCVPGKSWSSTGNVPCNACSQPMCGPGKRLQTCTPMTDSVCVSCPAGTYSSTGTQEGQCSLCSDPHSSPSTDFSSCVCTASYYATSTSANPSCMACSSCTGSNSAISSACSPTSDTVCGCSTGYTKINGVCVLTSTLCAEGTYSSSDGKTNCVACSSQPTCGAGTGPRACTKTTNTGCAPCPKNTFSLSGTCTACSNPTCGPGKRLQACTATSNAVCVPCAEKTFSLTGTQSSICTPCADPAAVSDANFTSCICTGLYYAPFSHADPACAANPTCGTCSIPGPGQRKLSNCSSESDALVKPCDDGTFSVTGTLSDTCSKCSTPPTCGPAQHLRACIASSDVKCVSCEAGSFSLSGTQSTSCTKCSNPKCGPGKRLQPCTNTTDAVCIPFSPKTFSVNGTQLSDCDPCLDPNSSSSADFSSCTCSGPYEAPLVWGKPSRGWFAQGSWKNSTAKVTTAGPNVVCNACSTCNLENQTIGISCTPTTNTVCGCNSTSATCCPSGSWATDGATKCRECSTPVCRPGSFLKQCTVLSDAECSPCPARSYSKVEEYSWNATYPVYGNYTNSTGNLVTGIHYVNGMISANGTLKCLPCTDPHAISNKDASACVCSVGYFATSKGLDPTCSACASAGPGQQVVKACSNVSDTVVAECEAGTWTNPTYSAPGTQLSPCPNKCSTPICGPGQRLQYCTNTSDAACIDCAAHTYSYFGTNTDTCNDCTSPATLCKAGNYLKDCTTTSNALCDLCPEGTYSVSGTQEHFCTTCGANPTCNAGQRLQTCGPKAEASCVACGAKTWSAGGSATKCSICSAPVCNPGEYLRSCTATLDAACLECPEATYSIDGTTVDSCTPTTKCTKSGENVKTSATKTSDAVCGCISGVSSSCKNCADAHAYFSNSDSKCKCASGYYATDTTADPTCLKCSAPGPGQRRTNSCSPTADATLVACSAGTYSSSGSMSDTCESMCTVPGPGQEVLSNCSASQDAVIQKCPPNTFSVNGAQKCTKCSDPNAVSHESASSCLCAPGYFKTNSTAIDPVCQKCTACDGIGQTIVTKCNQTVDATCNCAPANSVTIGGRQCAVTEATATYVRCLTPPTSSSETTQANLAIDGNSVASKFTYDTTTTPLITSMSPMAVSAAISNKINLTVSPVPSTLTALQVNIIFGEQNCEILTFVVVTSGSKSTASIMCLLVRNLRVEQTLKVVNLLAPSVLIDVPGYGYAAINGPAAPPGGFFLNASFGVTGIYPPAGSLWGGTVITIYGAGFLGVRDATSISFIVPQYSATTTNYDVDCALISVAADGSSLTCTLARPSYESDRGLRELRADPDHAIWGFVQVFINNIASPCVVSNAPSTCNYENSCAFKLDWLHTPSINSMTPIENDKVLISGKLLDAPVKVWFGTVESTNVTVVPGGVIAEPPVQAAGNVSLFVWSGQHGTADNNFLGKAGWQVDVQNIVDKLGFAHAPPKIHPLWNWTYAFKINKVFPTHLTGSSSTDSDLAGSCGGGQSLTIIGTGFSPSLWRNVVSFEFTSESKTNNYLATIISASPTQLLIRTPALLASSCKSSFSNQLSGITVKLLNASASTTALFSLVLTSKYTFTAAPELSACTSAKGGASSSVKTSVGAVITCSGTSLGASSTVNAVSLGSVACSITSWTSTSFSCTVGATAAGNHTLIVLSTLGRALPAPFFVVDLSVTGISRTSVGVGGGAPLVITGSGFAPLSSYPAVNNTVKICGFDAPIVAASSTSITVLSPVLQTPLANDKYNTYETLSFSETMATVTADEGSTALNPSAAVDGDPSTVFGSCGLTFDLGPDIVALPTRIRFFPSIKYIGYMYPWETFYHFFAGSTFYGSPGPNATTGKIDWTLLATAESNDKKILDGWNVLDLSVPPAGAQALAPLYRMFRWKGDHHKSLGFQQLDSYDKYSYKCVGQEIDFIGKLFVRNGGAACNVTISTKSAPVETFTSIVVSNSVVAPTSLAASITMTPVVTALTPSIGSALGGDTVTFTGSGFGTSIENVALNGMPCTVVGSVTSTSFKCLTGVRTMIMPVSVVVNVTNVGLALVNSSTTTYFSYLDKWSNTNTWLFDEPPGDGDSVIVPKGQAILVDVSPPELVLVLVEGEMRFDQTKPNLTFDASYIYILGGKFIVGTEANPYLNDLTITLHGDRTKSIEIPGAGAKCLAVMNSMAAMEKMLGMDTYSGPDPTDAGAVQQAKEIEEMSKTLGSYFGLDISEYGAYHVIELNPIDPLTMLLYTVDSPNQGGAVPLSEKGIIDIHGAPRKRVWTFGNAPVAEGDITITTLEPTDWKQGDRIVIGPTNHEGNNTEVRTVVSNTGYVVTFDEPLDYEHDCFVYKQPGYTNTRICWEAGLLTRNIVIQGDDKSLEQQFGMHSIAAMGAVMRVENAEFRLCGQSLVVGRYCTHIHLAADEGESFIRANSFHDSFQRAAAVHATNNIRIADNFAFKVMAHSFFIEDGVEHGNTFEGNLIIGQLSAAGPIKSDGSASCFWAASLPNNWKSNVCSGVLQGNAWWFQPPDNPTGPSFSPRIQPQFIALGTFFNNTAHSIGFGTGVIAWQAGMASLAAPTLFNLDNITIWRVHHATAMDHYSSGIQFNGFKVLDCVIGSLFQLNDMGLLGEQSGRPNILDSLYVASFTTDEDSPGAFSKMLKNTSYNVFNRVALGLPDTSGFWLSGVTFVNYGQNVTIGECHITTCSCLFPTDFYDDSAQYQGGYVVHRVDRLTYINSPRRMFWTYTNAVNDLDGSFSGTKGQMVMTYRPYLDWPGECDRDLEGVYGFGLVCKNTVNLRYLEIWAFDPERFAGRVMIQGRGPELSFGNKNDPETRDVWRKDPFTQTPWSCNCRRWNAGFFVPHHTYSMRWDDLEPWHHEAFHMDTDLTDWAGYHTWGNSWLRGGPEDGMIIRLGSMQKVWRFASSYDEKYESPLPLLPSGTIPNISHQFGTLAWPSYGKKSGSSFETHLSLYNAIPSKKTFVNVYAIQIDPSGETIPDSPADAPPPVEWKLWSDVIKGTYEKGDNVNISSTDSIILDVAVPESMGQLVVFGRLKFSDDIDIILNLENLIVWGSLFCGNATVRHLRKVEIVLWGYLGSDDVAVNQLTFLSHKGVYVFGEASFAGKPLTTTWTRLKSTATTGDKEITLTTSVGSEWKSGDEIVLSETEYSPLKEADTTIETAIIDSISSDGKVITLKSALKFRHFAGPLADSGNSGNSVVLAAAVGLLTRNIVIRGEMDHMYINRPSFGGRVLVGTIGLGHYDNEFLFGGTLYADGVMFKDLGQDELPVPALHIKNDKPVNVKPSSVVNCAFTKLRHTAFSGKNVQNLAFTGNVIHRAWNYGVYFDSSSTNQDVSNNLVAGLYQSPTCTTCGGDPEEFSAFMIPIPLNYKLRNNYASGIFSTAYSLYALPCSMSNSVPYSNNEASGVSKGFVALNPLPEMMGSVEWSCTLLKGPLTVWKASYMAVYMPDMLQKNVLFQDAILADNHIGFYSSGEPTFGSPGGIGGVPHTVTVKSVKIFGFSSASTCSASIGCRTNSDRSNGCISILKDTMRSGIYLPYNGDLTNVAIFPKLDENGQMWHGFNGMGAGIAQPLEQPTGGVGAPFLEMRLESVLFSAWKEDPCKNSQNYYALMWGGYESVMPFFGNSITWDKNVQEGAKFGLNGDRSVGIDTDGTFLGMSPGSSVMSPATAAFMHADDNPACEMRSAWRCAYACQAKVYSGITYYNMDMLLGSARNILGPMTITRTPAIGSQYSVTLKPAFITGPNPPPVLDNIRMMGLGGDEQNWVGKATEPVQGRFLFSSHKKEDKFLISYFVTRPNSQAFFIDGQAYPTLNDRFPDTPAAQLPMPNISSPVGTALYRLDLKTFFFVAGGGYHYYDIVRRATVQVSIKVKLPATTGGTTGGGGSTGGASGGTGSDTVAANKVATSLAALLGIDPSRVKVVSVHSSRRLELNDENGNSGNSSIARFLQDGGTAIDFEIYPSQPAVASNPTVTVGAPATPVPTSPSSSGGTTPTTGGTTTTTTTTTKTTVSSTSATADPNQGVVYAQQTEMASLGSAMQEFSTSGVMADAIASSVPGAIVADIGVTVPVVTVSKPTPIPTASGNETNSTTSTTTDTTTTTPTQQLTIVYGIVKFTGVDAVATATAAIRTQIKMALAAQTGLPLTSTYVIKVTDGAGTSMYEAGTSKTATTAAAGSTSVYFMFLFSDATNATDFGDWMRANTLTFTGNLLKLLTASAPAAFGSSAAVTSLALSNVPGRSAFAWMPPVAVVVALRLAGVSRTDILAQGGLSPTGVFATTMCASIANIAKVKASQVILTEIVDVAASRRLSLSSATAAARRLQGGTVSVSFSISLSSSDLGSSSVSSIAQSLQTSISDVVVSGGSSSVLALALKTALPGKTVTVTGVGAGVVGGSPVSAMQRR